MFIKIKKEIYCHQYCSLHVKCFPLGERKGNPPKGGYSHIINYMGMCHCEGYGFQYIYLY